MTDTIENEATAEIRHLISGLPGHSGSLLDALHAVQHHFGYIPREAITAIGRHLRLSDARVYGAITYYADFRLTPPPQHLIEWCSGPSCQLRDGEDVLEAMQAVLGIGPGENTPDNKVGIRIAQCNGTCAFAPQIWIDGKVVGPLTVPAAIRLARELASGTERGPAIGMKGPTADNRFGPER